MCSDCTKMSDIIYRSPTRSTQESLINEVDASEFRRVLMKKLNVKDDVGVTVKLKKILLNPEEMVDFCKSIGYSPSDFVRLMVEAKLDILREPRIVPKLKAFLEQNGLNIDS